MSELITIIRMSYFFMTHILIVIMMGILIIKLLEGKNKKNIIFLMMVYLVLFGRVILDLLTEYGNVRIPNSGLVNVIYSVLIFLVPAIFVLRNRGSIGKEVEVFFMVEGLILNVWLFWSLIILKADNLGFLIAFPMIWTQHFLIFFVAMNYLIKNEN